MTRSYCWQLLFGSAPDGEDLFARCVVKYGVEHDHSRSFEEQLTDTAIPTDDVTMRDLVEAEGSLVGETFDYALPIGWVDDVKAKTGEWPRFFVWHYPRRGLPGHIFGQPFPLTPSANRLLDKYEGRR